MRVISSVVKVAIVGSIFGAGLVAGTINFGPAIADTIFNQNQAGTTGFQKNEDGQTYGSGLDASSPAEEPDLIKAYGIDGNIGYVRSADLYGEMPKTPEELLAKQKQRAAEGGRYIPLYDVDGKTVIGKFHVSPGTSK